jgi:hypothetical protein
MRESDTEGVATRSGPESCAVVRKDGGEALTGVRAGWAIEPRNQCSVGADVVVVGGRQYRWPRYRELPADPARSKNLCMHGISACENREVPWSPVPVDDAPPYVVRGVAYRSGVRAAGGRPRP